MLLKSSIIYCILTWFGILLLNQNRNAACGRHKEEIFRQLRVLVKSEPNLFSENVDVKPLKSLASEQNMQRGSLFTGFEHDAEPTVFPAYEVCFSYVNVSACRLNLKNDQVCFFHAGT